MNQRVPKFLFPHISKLSGVVQLFGLSYEELVASLPEGVELYAKFRMPKKEEEILAEIKNDEELSEGDRFKGRTIFPDKMVLMHIENAEAFYAQKKISTEYFGIPFLLANEPTSEFL